MMHKTVIRVLGSGSAHPDSNNDTASYLINHHILVDTGWHVVRNLKACGINPLSIDHLLFTHMHHDHYISLPSLLFELLDRGKSLEELNIIGPADDVERVVKLTLQFLQIEEFYPDRRGPAVIPLEPGESYEAETFRFDTCATVHTVKGLCYRFEDKLTGSVFAITGDTAPHPPLAEFIRGSSLLITEASLGPGKADPEKNGYLHSGALDAARLAADAGVRKLYLVHGPAGGAKASIEAAKTIFNGSVEWPGYLQEIIVD